jgi:uncharacterized Rmd1/YagE family protein
MDRLGISNDRVRPSHRTTAPPLSNPSRRRRRLPIRQSEPRPGALYPIKAMHIAQTIDLDAVMKTILCDNMEKRKLFGKNSLVVELAAQAHPEPPRFVAVFRFGSIVFLNVPTKDAAVLTERIRKVSTDAVKTGTERRENFGVMVQPEGLYPTSVPPPELVVTADYCIVPEVDINGVAVISNIMAQTVALDSYNDTVDTLLSKFAGINSAVRATGTFQSSDRTFLFKTVAQNNAIFIDMVSKTRLKDRSDTAWTMTRYETIHYGLKSEFGKFHQPPQASHTPNFFLTFSIPSLICYAEIDGRFDQIEYKLNLIQQNAKFFLEVMQHQKSNSLEWIIVLLIGAECVIMCIDMSGMGEPFFRSLGLVS